MSQPLVSIIIPTFNRAHLIVETLNSVKVQTYSNWECIIVDDGSSDDTEQVIARFCSTDPRFVFYKRPENTPKGANTCRNLGFDFSSGDYINWFDSDDVMYPDFIERKVQVLLEQPEMEVVSSGFIKYNPEQNITSKPYNTELHKHPLEEYAHQRLSLNTPTFLYKRSILTDLNFDEKLTRAQDLDFTFKVISKPNIKMAYCNEVLFKVLIHQESITGKFTAKTSIAHLKSELHVRKHIAFFYIHHNQKLTKYIFDNYLKTLKKILENRYIGLCMGEIQKVPKISGYQKLKLIGIALLFWFTGKGLVSFSKEIQKINV